MPNENKFYRPRIKGGEDVPREPTNFEDMPQELCLAGMIVGHMAGPTGGIKPEFAKTIAKDALLVARALIEEYENGEHTNDA